MRTSHYDVVVIGAELTPLLAAALIARRGFRVLVLGHRSLPASYEVEGLHLPRDPFLFLSTNSPATERALDELALSQVFRRSFLEKDPAFQAAIPGHRFDAARDPTRRAAEVEREFPKVARPISDFYEETREFAARLDTLVSRDLVWPPASFFDRREFTRLTAPLMAEQERRRDPLRELPERHPFRSIVRACARFATHAERSIDRGLSYTRAFDSFNQAAALEGGEAWIRAQLIERIRAQGGEVSLAQRVDRITTRRTTIDGVVLAGSGHEVGCTQVVFGDDLDRLTPLLRDRDALEAIQPEGGAPRCRFYRYTVNVVVEPKVVPAGMSDNLLYRPADNRPGYGSNLLWIQRSDLSPHTLLTLGLLLPRRGVEEVDGYIHRARERAVAALDTLMPYRARGTVLIDSPHDGRDTQIEREGTLRPHPEPWTRGVSTMRRIHNYPSMGPLGLSALPARTSVRGLLLASPQVLPGMTHEGMFITASSVAKLVARRDRRPWTRRRRFGVKLT